MAFVSRLLVLSVIALSGCTSTPSTQKPSSYQARQTGPQSATELTLLLTKARQFQVKCPSIGLNSKALMGEVRGSSITHPSELLKSVDFNRVVQGMDDFNKQNGLSRKSSQQDFCRVARLQIHGKTAVGNLLVEK